MKWFPRKIEQSRQKLLLVFRLIINTFLALTVVLLYINGRTPYFWGYWSYAITIALILAYASALIHYFVWPRFFGPAVQIILQMTIDIILASALIILTGGGESAIVFVFILGVINSAFLGGLKISFIAAALSTLAWAAIVDLHYYGYIPGLSRVAETMTPSELALNILVNTGASYLVAILSGHLSSQLDISSQALVTSQNSLDRLSELNDNIIHSIDSGLITTDKQERILSVNQAGRSILKLSSGEMVGRPWRFFFPELSSVPDIPIRKSHSQEHVEGIRFKHIRYADQAELIIELSMMDLQDEGNSIWGRLLVMKDRTAISKMEADVKRSEHLAAIGQLAAGLAHEIRTPLASMTGSWHMLLNQGLTTDDHNRMMNIIGREMERLGQLVNSFLTFARPPVGNPQPVDLNRIISDQLHILGGWQGAEADLEFIPGNIGDVLFDHDQLTQIIWNILQNAMEAADPKNKLIICIKTRKLPSDSENIVLTISDNGRGIPEEHIKHIFEPFYTTKTRGTGLGLATVWGIIRNGNGNVSVSSQPGHNTTFTITLPAA